MAASRKTNQKLFIVVRKSSSDPFHQNNTAIQPAPVLSGSFSTPLGVKKISNRI